MIPISFFPSERDPYPQAYTLSWQQLAEWLSKPRVGTCTAAPGPAACVGKNCPHKYGPSWSPAVYPPGATRGKANVAAVSVLALDLDHLTEQQIAEADAQLRPFRYIAHSTHNDRPGDRALRVVIPLSRPVLLAEWPRFWLAAIDWIGVAADRVVKDAGRLFFLPSTPADVPFTFGTNEGAILDVEAVLARAPAAPPVTEWTGTLGEPSAPHEYGPASPALIEHIKKRLEEHGPSIRNQGGDKHAFMVGAILLHEFALTNEEAWPLAVWWNDRFPENTWTHEKLAQKVINGARYASGEYGAERERIDTRPQLAAALTTAAAEFLPPSPAAAVNAATAAPPPPPGAPEQPGQFKLGPEWAGVTAGTRAAFIVDRIVEQAQIPAVQTPFAKLNAYLDGLSLHSNTIIIGGTGKGKSSLAGEFAAHHAKTGPVIYYVGEMTAALVVGRVLGQQLGRSWADVMRGRVPREDMDAALASLQLYMVPRQGNPIAAIAATLMLAKAEGCTGVPMLVIDYIQLLADVGKDMRLSTMDACRNLQQFIEEVPCVAITLSQASRSASKRLREGAENSEDLNDTGAETAELERGATNLLNITYESKDGAEEHDVILAVSKCRFRGPGKLGMKFNGKTGRWTEQDHIPQAAGEADLELEIIEQIRIHTDRNCLGQGIHCGGHVSATSLSSKSGTHRIGGNKAAYRSTLDRLARDGKIRKEGVGYVLARAPAPGHAPVRVMPAPANADRVLGGFLVGSVK